MHTQAYIITICVCMDAEHCLDVIKKKSNKILNGEFKFVNHIM